MARGAAVPAVGHADVPSALLLQRARHPVGATPATPTGGKPAPLSIFFSVPEFLEQLFQTRHRFLRIDSARFQRGARAAIEIGPQHFD
jgi:hypothetical protein